ncbi:uncharacterized protein LOC130791467 [Actinidia eriantha]|uniref:uncharacterized protein LOC130791467 n=1 Tax=Actinidia eriantha TaxID=165200 RepID=UPI00258308F3|nr:uncharacterized protein LOC130791467 [Actinidia eriantha]
MSNTSPVADETSRLSRQATSNEHFACSNSSLFSNLDTAVNFLWGFIFLIIFMAGICDAFLLQGICAAPTRCDNAAVDGVLEMRHGDEMLAPSEEYQVGKSRGRGPAGRGGFK